MSESDYIFVNDWQGLLLHFLAIVFVTSIIISFVRSKHVSVSMQVVSAAAHSLLSGCGRISLRSHKITLPRALPHLIHFIHVLLISVEEIKWPQCRQEDLKECPMSVATTYKPTCKRRTMILLPPPASGLLSIHQSDRVILLSLTAFPFDTHGKHSSRSGHSAFIVRECK